MEYITKRCIPWLIARVEDEENKRIVSAAGQLTQQNANQIVHNLIVSWAPNKFLANVSFSTSKTGIKQIRFLKATFAKYFNNVPNLIAQCKIKKCEFSSETGNCMWYQRYSEKSSGDFTRKLGFAIESGKVPSEIFHGIKMKLEEILDSDVVITQETDIKRELDHFFFGSQVETIEDGNPSKGGEELAEELISDIKLLNAENKRKMSVLARDLLKAQNQSVDNAGAFSQGAEELERDEENPPAGNKESSQESSSQQREEALDFSLGNNSESFGTQGHVVQVQRAVSPPAVDEIQPGRSSKQKDETQNTTCERKDVQVPRTNSADPMNLEVKEQQEATKTSETTVERKVMRPSRECTKKKK